MGSNSSRETARDALFLTVAAISPFTLRSAGDWLISLIVKRFCNMTKKEFRVQLIGAGNSDVTIENIWEKKFTFSQARNDLKINTCAAISIALIRLIFWHWMQQLLYFFVLYAYWDLLDDGQHILGLIVSVREGTYLLLTFIALCMNPSFLMIDLKASWNSEVFTVLTYVIAPEKFVFLAVVDNRNGFLLGCGMISLILLDLAGIVAFIYAFAVNYVYVPMMIGYGVTTTGGLFSIIFLLLGCCIVDD
eukprot:354621_1